MILKVYGVYLSLCCLVVWWNGEYSERRLKSDSLCAGNAMALIIEPRCDVDVVLEASSAINVNVKETYATNYAN